MKRCKICRELILDKALYRCHPRWFCIVGRDEFDELKADGPEFVSVRTVYQRDASAAAERAAQDWNEYDRYETEPIDVWVSSDCSFSEFTYHAVDVAVVLEYTAADGVPGSLAAEDEEE